MESSWSSLHANLSVGDPAPWFHQRSSSKANFVFSSVAGRYIVLCFFGSAAEPRGRAALQSVLAHRHHFDDISCSFFGVSNDPEDERQKRVASRLPGIRFFWDSDGKISRLYGAIAHDATLGKGETHVHRFWVVLDPTLRVLFIAPFAADGSDADALFGYLEKLPPPDRFAGIEVQAPILFLPNVFEEDLCRGLIRVYEDHGGKESGVMRDVEGRTALINDHSFKKRRDYTIEQPELLEQTRARVARRIYPEILKIYSFKATRMERYLVSCYSADDGAHFRPHRDNTTRGTAHRRFAVSINLNSEFEGGEICFPEYGRKSFKPPPGGAVIFPCALLHAVTKVTSGSRYAFLPFLYDEEAAKIREANAKFLGGARDAVPEDEDSAAPAAPHQE